MQIPSVLAANNKNRTWLGLGQACWKYTRTKAHTWPSLHNLHDRLTVTNIRTSLTTEQELSGFQTFTYISKIQQQQRDQVHASFPNTIFFYSFLSLLFLIRGFGVDPQWMESISTHDRPTIFAAAQIPLKMYQIICIWFTAPSYGQ